MRSMRCVMTRGLLVLLSTLLLASSSAGAARANPVTNCGLPGYSYAGVGAVHTASGVSARLRIVKAPVVTGGHVAAWVGFGGYGAGKGGTDAWIQAGIITKAGGVPTLYYEITRPGYKPKLVPLRAASPGRTYEISVRELASPGRWQAFVDGRPVSAPVSLPGSHASWQPTATAESWDGGSASCNRFGFAFERVTGALDRLEPVPDGLPARRAGLQRDAELGVELPRRQLNRSAAERAGRPGRSPDAPRDAL